MAKLITSVEILTGDTGYDVPVEVHYTRYDGCRETLEQPAEQASVEIGEVRAIDAGGKSHDAPWLTDLLSDDEDLRALCMEDWADAAEYAADQRADAIREDRMLGDGA